MEEYVSNDKNESKAIGGYARAQALTPEKRQEIARRAAEKRWGQSIPVTEHDGVLKIVDMEFPCAVLSDGTRVLTEMDFMKVMGIYRSGALSTRREESDSSGARMPLYLAFKNLKPFIDKHLGSVHVQPLVFRTQKGMIAHGIPAEVIPKICDVWLDARKEGVLGHRQEEIAAHAEILMRGLAHVGIIALVDEATGFQELRDRVALQAILDRYLRKEFAAWAKRFPDEFYEQIFRLRKWTWKGMQVNRPQIVAAYTKDIVYARLAPGILKELETRNLKDEQGHRRAKHHQWLTEDVGHPALAQHLYAVIGLMRIADSWDMFKKMLDRAYPKRGDSLQLELFNDPIPGLEYANGK